MLLLPLIVITIFTLPSILIFRIEMIRKILILILSSTLILILYIFGTYELSKNNNYLKTVKEKINVKATKVVSSES